MLTTAPDSDERERDAIEVVARVVHGAVAGCVTYALGHVLGLGDAAREVAVLNAGVAYYTDDAAGRIQAAVRAVLSRLDTTTPRVEDDAYAQWLERNADRSVHHT